MRITLPKCYNHSSFLYYFYYLMEVQTLTVFFTFLLTTQSFFSISCLLSIQFNYQTFTLLLLIAIQSIQFNCLIESLNETCELCIFSKNRSISHRGYLNFKSIQTHCNSKRFWIDQMWKYIRIISSTGPFKCSFTLETS